MEKIDLREINKMVTTFRKAHRALAKLRETGRGFEILMHGNGYGRSGCEVPIIDAPKTRQFLIESLESELSRLRREFAKMGVDPMVESGRKKKAKLAIAK